MVDLPFEGRWGEGGRGEWDVTHARPILKRVLVLADVCKNRARQIFPSLEGWS